MNFGLIKSFILQNSNNRTRLKLLHILRLDTQFIFTSPNLNCVFNMTFQSNLLLSFNEYELQKYQQQQYFISINSYNFNNINLIQ